MKFLIDFRDSENKEIADSNLKKYGIEVEESKLENSTCIIETDLGKEELAKLIRIPLGKVVTNSRTARSLVVLRVSSENYISENEDSTESVNILLDKLSIPNNEEETKSSAPTEDVGENQLNPASQLYIKPSVKTFTAAVVGKPKGELGFGNSFLNKFPLNTSKDDKKI